MRELAKSLVSYGWAVTVYSLDQAGELMFGSVVRTTMAAAGQALGLSAGSGEDGVSSRTGGAR